MTDIELFFDSIRQLDWQQRKERAQDQLWEALTDDERQQWLDDQDAECGETFTMADLGYPERSS